MNPSEDRVPADRYGRGQRNGPPPQHPQPGKSPSGGRPSLAPRRFSTPPDRSGQQQKPPPAGRRTGHPKPSYRQSAQQPGSARRYYVPPPPPPPPPPQPRRRGWGSTALLSLAIVVGLFLVAVCLMAAGYAAIAADLPAPEALRGRSASFMSTRIYDRNGNLLHEILDPGGGRRILVPLNEISPHLINATVATEDERFWQHPGVDPVAFIRAVYYNLSERRIVSGFSSIPQQLVRLVLLSPEERTQQTVSRKIREAVLASEVSRRYTKQEILEIYLNEINYGNLAYGIEAAAETYFGKSAGELDLAEAAFLAGLPQAPAYWDPYTNPEGAKQRQGVVLDLMAEAGYISRSEAEAAKAADLELQPPQLRVEAPHFVTWVQQLLEQKYGADVLYRSGLRVTTTLDSRLQAIAQQEARAHLEQLQDRHATNAALVAIKPDTGEIVAMLGSADFHDPEIDGQVNVALRLRQPGSSIKPVTYVTAFEKGWTPATLIWDVTTEFHDALGRPYVPKNYDGEEHGPVLVRAALARSLNIPAVKTLDFVGLPAMLDTAHRLGIESLNRPDYGLSLTLGGGDVTLLELTGAYAAFANGGQRLPPVAILRIEDSSGQVIEEYRQPAGEQVISPQHAYLITDILSDNAARAPAFGANNVLKLSRPAAAKTGTTDDWRDAWTVGYTPDLVAGVWVGNADNTAMKNVAGSRGAGPIWHNFMERALEGQPARQFARPEGIEAFEICVDGGALPTDACPPDRRRTEIFAAGQGPLGPEYGFHQFIRIDRSTEALAIEYCPADLVEERYYLVLPGEEGQRWAQQHNIPQPPQVTCPVHTGPADVQLFQPLPGETVSGEVLVVGRANMPGFDHYIVEYGEGQDPLGWGLVAGPVYAPVDGGLLATWDVSVLPNRDYTLRVVAFDQAGHGTEARTWVVVRNEEPTATVTPTATPTSTPTSTPTWTPTPPSTSTPLPTWTPTPTSTSTPTPTSTPTLSPTPTATPSPTDSPTATPSPTPTPTQLVETPEPDPTP